MVRQETWNPKTKQWEMLTPQEWRLLSAGFNKDATVEDYIVSFKLDPISALKYYTQTEHDEFVALFFIELFVKMNLQSPTEMWQFSRWCLHTFYYPEIRAFYAPIYKLRKVMHEAKQLCTEGMSTPTKRRNRR